MTDHKEQEKPDKTKLPAEVRAEMLSAETSLFFNVAKFEHAQRVADMFARSTMVPEHFRNNVGNCMIGLNYASRVGADPFMMLQCMYVVHGKPGIEGKLVAGLINQSGKYRLPLQYEWLGANDQAVDRHKVVTDSMRDERGCRAFTVEARSGEIVRGPKITWEIIHAEGWYNKTGSKWKTMPELMFMYRAASWFANIHCPEVKLGMATTEELRDIVDLKQGPNGTYATDLTEKIKPGKEGTAKELYSRKDAPIDNHQGEPESTETEERERNDIPPSRDSVENAKIGQQFANLTGMLLSKFQNLRDVGMTDFLYKHRDEISSWPEPMRKIIEAKCANKPEWQELLHPPIDSTETKSELEVEPEPEANENKSYMICPLDSGSPYAGKQISPMVVCSNCKKAPECDDYQLYLDAQRGGNADLF